MSGKVVTALRKAMDRSPFKILLGDRELFRPLVESLLDHDKYMLLADIRRIGIAGRA